MRVVAPDNTFITPIGKFGRITNEQILVVAKCLSNDSLIKTSFGNKKLGDIKEGERFEVISFNLETKKEELDSAIKIKSGMKEVFEIETESGKKIKASKDHIFFVMEQGKIIEKKLEELKVDDRVIITN